MTESDPTRVVIAGAGGRMGKALVRCVMQSPLFALGGALESGDHPGLGSDCGEWSELAPTGIPIRADAAAVLPRADVLIDFTFHTVAPLNAAAAARLGKPIVVGTTGLDEQETGRIKAAAERVAVVWAPNMSLGMNLLFVMVRRAAAALGLDYSVVIEETHHVHKLDAPSGTALRLGEKVADGRGQDFERVMLHDPERSENPDPGDGVLIRSFRRGEVVGDHCVRFANPGEVIEFCHHAASRDAFALGALRAAQWVTGQPPGLYDMQDVLGL